MKKNVVLIFLLIMSWSLGFSQNTWRDSLRNEIANATSDTSRVNLLIEMCSSFKFERPDSAIFYGFRALTLARQINFTKGEVEAMQYLSASYAVLGNEVKAFQLHLEGSKIAEKNNLTLNIAILKFVSGNYYLQDKNYAKAIIQLKESILLFDSINDVSWSTNALSKLGETFLLMNLQDSALLYSNLALEKSNQEKGNWAEFFPLLSLGKVYTRMGNTNLALTYLKQSLIKARDNTNFINSNIAIAQLYQQMEIPDSSIFYAKKSLETAMANGFYNNIIEANLLLANIYETKDIIQAYQYSRQAIIYKDSLKNLEWKTSKETFFDFDEQERQREIYEAKDDFQNRLRTNAFLGITFTLLVIAFFLFRNNRIKQKAKQKIEKAYTELKSTQAQLIQSEKMASLGELTAGIAHEIQNPLNFVNNFSEVSAELIDEMKEELAVGNMQLANEIAVDIRQNLEKINHHGKRADAIVKGMLQHSRTSTGQKEPTDINALCDEYLRLAYHGMRAKDKSFNADFKTEFDPNLPKINVIPQDIGRVLLNLINNAFYTVGERGKKGEPGFAPTVTVTTRQTASSQLQVTVKDNGPGIPDSVKDKIFQPFFTTKPTGQGTGLGLSLTYDIVKAHGGEINVETKDGEGTEFIIQLPM